VAGVCARSTARAARRCAIPYRSALRTDNNLAASSGVNFGFRATTLLQFLMRYPVLNSHDITARHSTKNPTVMQKLVTTLTSATP